MQTYLWIDLETTGLDEKVCEITEIAAILTEGPETDFREIKSMVSLVEISRNAFWQRTAIAMAEQSGLLEDMDDRSTALPGIPHTELRLLDLIGTKTPILAARNCSFERRFIARYMPDLSSRLHYREFDITTLRCVDPGLDRQEVDGLPGTPHRAEYDIRRDLELAREFVRKYQGA